MRVREQAPSAERGAVEGAVGPSPGVAAFAVAVLVLSTGAFVVLRTDGGEASSPLVLILWLAAYAVATLGLLDQRFRQRRPLPLPVLFLGFVLWALLSTTWSVAAPVSLRRAIALGGTLAVGLFLAQRLRPVDVFEAVRRATVIVAVASLVLYAVGDPRVLDGVHQTLRGVVATKNTLGRIMAIGLIATAAAALLDRRRRRRCGVSALPLVLALVLTESAGGMILAAVGVIAIGAAALWRFDHGKAALPLVLFATSGALVLLLLAFGLSVESLLAFTGRDTTLTGRTDIWAQSLEAGAQRPLLGAGYGAFWGVGSSEGSDAAARISARLAEPVANAHNGLLEIWLDTGMVGVVLAIAVLARLLVSGVRDAGTGNFERSTLRLVVLALLLVSTAVESGLLQENAILTLLVAVAMGNPGTPVRVREAAERFDVGRAAQRSGALLT